MGQGHIALTWGSLLTLLGVAALICEHRVEHREAVRGQKSFGQSWRVTRRQAPLKHCQPYWELEP